MFVVVPDGQEMAVINLHQITMIHGFSGERATFEMSSGKSITIHGGEAVARILGFIAHETITLQGKPFPEFIEELCTQGKTVK
ncbi:MAG: hypothetical protein ABSC77_06785 [Terracidiphilus sp.]|jgi:hypothetical protein